MKGVCLIVTKVFRAIFRMNFGPLKVCLCASPGNPMRYPEFIQLSINNKGDFADDVW